MTTAAGYLSTVVNFQIPVASGCAFAVKVVGPTGMGGNILPPYFRRSTEANENEINAHTQTHTRASSTNNKSKARQEVNVWFAAAKQAAPELPIRHARTSVAVIERSLFPLMTTRLRPEEGRRAVAGRGFFQVAVPSIGHPTSAIPSRSEKRQHPRDRRRKEERESEREEKEKKHKKMGNLRNRSIPSTAKFSKREPGGAKNRKQASATCRHDREFKWQCFYLVNFYFRFVN